MSVNGSTAIDFSSAAGAATCWLRAKYRVAAAISAASTSTPGTQSIQGRVGRALDREAGGVPEAGIGAAAGGAAATAPAAAGCAKTAASLAKAVSRPSAATSTHCDSLRKYSKAGGSGASSRRTATICLRLEEARSSSLPTWEELIELRDNNRSSTGASLMALTIASAYSAPAGTSRGAIQQRMPRCSRYAVRASAVALSAAA